MERIMKKIYTAALLSGAVLTGAAFGPTVVNAQTTDDSTDTTVTDDTAQAERGLRGHRGDKGAAIAEILGITQDELRTAIVDGQTVADLATAQGIDIQTVIDAIVADMTEHVEEHVDAGDITEEQATERLATAEERVTERVNTVRVPGERRAERKAALAEKLGMTVDEVEAARADGATIRELAEEAGIELPERGEGRRGGHGHGADDVADDGADA